MFLRALTSDYIDLKEGNAGFDSWTSHLENAKIILWIGGILTAIFTIMLIIGVSMKSNSPKFSANSNHTVSQSKYDIFVSLENLDKLKDNGILTKEEYDEKKKKLLDKIK